MIGNRNRGKLKHILALLLALALAAGSAGAEEMGTLADVTAQEASFNLMQAEPQLTFRSGGEKVDSIEGADSLTLLFFGSAEHPLPQDTETVMYFELPRNVAAGELQDTEGDTVSTVYDAELNRLYFRWKSAGGGNAFSVTVPVKKREPFYTVNHILREGDGNEKLYRSETKPFTSGVLIREAPIEIEGYEGENAPYETEKRSDYDDTVTFYYHRVTLHYQVEYLAIDGKVLRPRSTFTGNYGDAIEPAQEIAGYRFVYCDQGDLPLTLTEENQYVSLRYSNGASWMPADLQQPGAEPVAAPAGSYIVRHVIPAEFTYGSEDVVLKTSAGTAGSPSLERAEQFEGKYYCDQSRTEITETGVTFYYRPVQLSVQLNYYEGYVGTNGPERRDPKDEPLRESKMLALWYGQDYNLNADVERQFTAGGTEYTFIGTDNVNRDLMYHGTEDNRIYNLYYISSVTQSGEATYQVTWKNWDGMVLETDQGVKAGESPSYNSITPIRPADEASLYEFAGWQPALSAVTGNAEYTASFNPIPRQYGVRFVNDDGTEIKLENLPYGTMPEAEAPEKEGTAEYTFSFAGWDPEIAPVTGDAVYRAVYTQETRQYTVRFTDGEGNELARAQYPYGTQPEGITPPEAPVKEPSAEFNYTFIRWEPALAQVTGDATYKAVFEENKRAYRVTWTDEKGKVLDTQNLEYGAEPKHDPITKEDTKENTYTFSGWDPEIAPVKEDVTYKAVFEEAKKKYPISWKDENGRELGVTEVEYGKVPSREDPEKEPNERNVYEFKGWSPRLREVTGPASYKATWETKPREYTVRFLAEDGSEISSASYRYGTQKGRISVPKAPEKAATDALEFTFAGWEPAVAEVTADAEYTAVYTESARSYRITWLDDNDEVLGAMDVAWGETPEAAAPVKAPTDEYSYEFAGWEPEVTEVAGEATYRATYTEKPREYIVRFVGENGEEISVAAYRVGTPAEEIALPETPVKPETPEFAYTFTGWTPEIAPVTGDATYQAGFAAAKKQYTIRFTDENGETLSETACDYGTPASAIPGPAVPTKEATADRIYTFLRWEPAVADVTGEATYQAVFEEGTRTYRVTWTDENGKVLDTQNLEYGAEPEHEAVRRADTNEYAYTFGGWDPEIAPVKEDVTYKAVVEAVKKKYPVTWRDENGHELGVTEVEYGEVPSREDPEKEPNERNVYEFKGWQPRLREVTGPASYKATYETKPREYTVRFLAEDGSEISSASYRYGTQKGRISVPKAPEKAATDALEFTFAGWEPAVAEVTADAEYTAVYTESARSYRITWLDDNDEVLGAMDVAWGETPEAAAPVKAPTDEYSYEFAGWEPEVTEVAGEATYRATYTEKPREYIVRFVGENGEELSAAAYRVGTPAEEIALPETPVKPETPEFAYTFTGWAPEIAPVTGDATYQAGFSTAKKQYAIRFTDENGETLSETACDYGTPASAIPGPAVPSKEATAEYSYTFAGWEPALADVTGEATYKAVFTASRNSYQVTWLWDDESPMDAAAVEYGTVPEHADPAKPATAEYSYTFTGWTPEIAPVTENAAYRAVFESEKRTYTIRFTDEEGREIGAAVYPYGTRPEEIAQPEIPEKEPTPRYVFRFTGWKPALSAVTGDAVYQAEYGRADREYTVRFLDSDGSEIASGSYPYDTPVRKIEIPKDPVRESTESADYVFTGWDKTIVNVRGDADYTATWREIKVYTVRFVNDDGTELSSARYQEGTPAGKIGIPENPAREATEDTLYTFAGWDKPVADVTEDATYTATWSETRIYTVSFADSDGTELSSARYPEGTPAGKIGIPENPAREATEAVVYTFTGWDRPVADVTENATYTAVYREDPRQYQVRFTDGEGNELTSALYGYGTAAEAVAVPEAPRPEPTAEYIYTFTGWDPELSDVTADVTYRAVYEAEKRSYTLHFVNEDGTELAAAAYEYGTQPDRIALPEVPAKENTAEFAYSFGGWEPAPAEVTGDAAYRAVFTAEKRSYTVRFLDGTGEEMTSATYEYGTAAGAMEIPEPQQTIETVDSVYTFARWQPAVETVTGDATYQAAYSVQPHTYLLHFTDEEGRELAALEYPYGTAPEAVQAPQAPAREATAEEIISFAGWDPALAPVTGEATYRAVYTSEPRPYTIRFLGDEGAVVSEAVYPYGTEAAKILLPKEVPQKAPTAEFSYSFVGWEPALEDVSGDAAYQALFEASRNKYEITWLDEEGREIDKTEVEYGAVPAHPDPEKEDTAEFDYTFAGWQPAPAAVTGNASYRAGYTVAERSYTVRFVGEDGSEIASAVYPYGTEAGAVAVPPAPEKPATAEEVYPFTGWDPAPADVTGDAVYTAVYGAEPRQYMVRFMDDAGRVIAEAQYPWGTPAEGIAQPEAPEKAATDEFHFTFTGWEPEITEVTADAAYRAVFAAEKNIYRITWENEDGSEIDTTEVEYGGMPVHAAAETENTPEFAYTFKTWKPALKPVTGNATYTAVYEKATRHYTVRFLDEAGNELSSHTYRYGSTVRNLKMPKNPEKPASAEFLYTFTGWEPTPADVTENVDYKPVFRETLRQYTVEFVNDDGKRVSAAPYDYGTKAQDVLMPDAPEKAPTPEYTYTFIGWDPMIADVTGDATYRAMYSAEKNTYLITWRDEDGSDLGIVEMEYGTEPVHSAADKDPSDEFIYAFIGWNPEPKPVTGDAVYTAVYRKTKRSYTVTWLDAAGEPLARQTLEYGVTPAMDGPEKEETEEEAYAFTGWDPAVAPVTGDVTYTPQYRTIRKITVQAADGVFEYDGKPHSSDGVAVTGGELAEGDTVVAETTGSVTDVHLPGVNTVLPESVRVLRGEEDVTEEYRIALLPGQLTVTPRKLTITTGSDEKPYDGTPLTDGTGETAGNTDIDGLVKGESITVVTNGEITEVGSAENTFTIQWGKTRETNYEVISRPGTLTVTENPAEIVLTAGSASKEYDGTPLAEDSVTAAGLPAGFTVQAAVTGSRTDAGTAANAIESYRILNAAGEDRTACFTGVATREGVLTVTPRTLNVVTADAEKEYDGLPLTAEGVTVEGLAEGESVTLAVTGSLTDVGMAENSFGITWDNAKEENYSVQARCGTLTVKPSTKEIVLSTQTAAVTYSGKPLKRSRITAEGLPEGYTVKGTVTGSQTQAGSSLNTLAEDYRIFDAEGEDRTEYFTNIRIEPGTLTVKPRQLVIVTGGGEKEYDGDPIWNEEITVEGLVRGESVTVRTNGSQTEKGSSLNTYLILWDHAKASNYVIREQLGRLTVK